MTSTKQSAGGMLDTALRYAELGYRVFPVVPGAKKPLNEHGCLEATTDPEQIHRWWKRSRRANIGLATADLIVIDIDGADNPWLADQPEKAIDLAAAPTSITPRGGRHHVFRQPHGKAWRNTESKLAPKVDTRAGGGYIVVAPSYVSNRGGYRWIDGCELDCPPEKLPEPPAWLAALLDGSSVPAVTRNGAPVNGEAIIGEGRRNAALTSLAGAMRRRGATEQEILAALQVANTVRCKPALADDEIQIIARSVSRYAPAAESHRPEIILGPDESRVTDQAITALADIDGIYQRGGSLVHIVSDAKAPKRIERAEDSLRIVRMPEARLSEIMGDAATWLRCTKGSGEQVEKTVVHPPDRIVRKVEARGEWKGIPPIEAVVEVPVLLADGSILTTPGFNRDFGLYFAPSMKFPAPIDNPNRDDAQWGADALLEVVADVPFKSDVHRAGWLCAAVTPFARQAYAGPTPLIVIDGNAPGVGKGLCVDAAAQIFTGRKMARTSNPRNNDEAAKLITSVALAGEPLILFDNVAGKFGCPALDAALTATSWSGRILGKTETTGELPLQTIWFLTANNLILGGDTPRRTLHIRLEFLGDNPEERSGFKHPNLLDWVASERGRLAIAAVTILRAYHLAGRPDMKLPPWGSFEGWSDLVRSAVVWAGMPDPAAARQELSRQSDGDAAMLRQLLDGWQELDPAGGGVTVGDAFELLAKHPEGFPKLRTALMEFPDAKDNKLPSRRAVGMKLHHWQRKVIDGRYFDRATNKTQNVARWVVQETV